MSYIAIENVKKTGRLLCALATALALASGWENGAAAQGRTTIRVGTLPIVTQLSLFTALDKGYFKDAGLDVQVQTFPGGAALLQALTVNAVDVAGAVNIITYFQAIEQGFDFVIVAGDSGIGTKLPDVAMIMTRKDSGINGRKDLAGKRFGLPNLKDINWLYNMEYLSRSGVDVGSIHWIEVGIPGGPAALLTGQVDVANLVEPFTTVALQSGEAKVLYSHFVEIAPGGLISIQAARLDWAKAHADALHRFVDALKQAYDYNQLHQQEARDRLTRYTKIDRNLTNKISWPTWKLFVEGKDLQIPMDLSVKYGLLKKPLPLDAMIFSSAVPR